MMNDNEIIRDFFMSRLERDGKSEALLDYTTGIRYYYQDFDVRSRKFANFLTDKAKIKKGDRVAICAGNCVKSWESVFPSHQRKENIHRIYYDFL